MEVSVSEGGASKTPHLSECISSQPTANEMLPHRNTEEAPPLCSNRIEDGDSSDDSLIDNSLTNDVSRLLSLCPAVAPPLWNQKGVNRSAVAPPPICTPPPSSINSPPPPSRHTGSSYHHHHQRHHQRTNPKRLSSTKSHTSFKTDAAQIKQVAGDVGACLACGGGVAGCCDAATCCCCMEAAGEAACAEEACQAVLDCGILEDCCSSADCLEICLECCSICFPS
ncbi:uncharacterized protein ACBR49_002461 [Aulostomus maculatus]